MLKAIIRTDRIDRQGNVNVFIRYTFQRKFKLFNTDVVVKNNQFNSKNGKVKSSDPNNLKKNILINREMLKIENIILDLQLKDEIPTLKRVYNTFHNTDVETPHKVTNVKIDLNTPIKNEYIFFEQYERMLKEKEELNEYAKSTINKHKTAIKKLKQFELNQKHILTFDDINKDTINKFVIYLYSKKLTDNSVDTYIKNIKTFMKWSYENKIHNNIDYNYIDRKRRNGDIITLSVEEIEKILKYNPKNDHLERTKDIIILGLSTGLRFSDITNLQKDNFYIKYDKNNNIISDKSYIELTIHKTQTTKHRIPFNNNIIYLIEKYDIQNKELKFNKITNSSFNEFLKELCKELEFNEIVRISRFIGNKEVIIEKPKHELVSSHILRKSFITYLLENNYSTELVQSLSGHKSYSSFKRYVNISMNKKNEIIKTFDNLLEHSLTEKKLDELKKLPKDDIMNLIKQLVIHQKSDEIFKNKTFTKELMNTIKDDKQLLDEVKNIIDKPLAKK